MHIHSRLFPFEAAIFHGEPARALAGDGKKGEALCFPESAKRLPRNPRPTLWLHLLFAMAFLTVAMGTKAATVWSGPKVVFTKADGADPRQTSNQDPLTPNVRLTRGNSQGLYNVIREATFSHSVSPADTEWASGTTANYAALKYTDWEAWARSVGNPPATPGVDAVLHLKTDDVYLDIKFLSWSERSGGFSYQRSTPGSVAVVAGAPIIGTATPGNSSASITFSAPTSDGGATITSYTVTCLPGNIIAVAPTSPITAVGLTNGTTYSCSVTATNSAGVGTASSKVSVTPLAPQITATLVFVSGWNLVGNGTEVPISMGSLLNDATKVISVWKWNASQSRWAFYTPTQSDGGAAYSTVQGYDALQTIHAGEGFWVNASSVFSISLPAGTAVGSASFRPAAAIPAIAVAVRALPSGWSLVATGDSPTPAQFNAAIGANPLAPAAAVENNLGALWAWNAGTQNWYFWAPSLVNNGGLSSYLSSKNYLDFSTIPSIPAGTMTPTTGFWVNMP
jgi:hypothetical protein